MPNPFGHIDLRVTSMVEARPFYGVLMPALGFAREYPSAEWQGWGAEGELPSAAYFAVTEDPSHRPNANRIAFWAADREKVDRIATLVRRLGANVTSGPQDYPEHGGTYYAVYFEDPCGNKLEVAYRIV
jgi:catechol 2,3-dioxygenase-like lactoylglutathione lyase family enzyme